MNDPQDDSLSLHALLLTVQGLVEEVFPAPMWVTCDIVSAQPRAKGYWRLQVQDPVLGGEATAEVMVWRTQVPAVIHRFERATGHPLQAGMRVLLQLRVTYSPKWGLGFVAQNIDPAFTVGQAQMEQDRIRRVLQEEGLWDRQRKLAAPRSFSRVALVAPDGSAGLGDVQRETDRLETVGLCRFDTYLAPFEGPNAIAALVRCLQQLDDPRAYDAILFIRGGGGTSGIQTLNHEALIRAVCQCPIPIFAGIGHERDHTLVDEAAFASLGTPSKAVGQVAGTLVAQAQEAQREWEALGRLVERRLADAQAQIEAEQTQAHHASQRLLTQATHEAERLHQHGQDLAERHLERAGQALDNLQETFRQSSEQLLLRAEHASQALIQEALTLGPQATLERGYAWVSSPQGPISRAAQARQASHLTLHFIDGTLAVQPDLSHEHP